MTEKLETTLFTLDLCTVDKVDDDDGTRFLFPYRSPFRDRMDPLISAFSPNGIVVAGYARLAASNADVAVRKAVLHCFQIFKRIILLLLLF